MSSPFDRLDRLASRAVDQLNGERFILTPMMKANPQGRPLRDPGRAVVEGKGVLDFRVSHPGIEVGSARHLNGGNDLRLLQSGREPSLSVDRGLYFLNALPRQGDSVTFPGRADLGAFEVATVQPDGQARVVLKLLVK